MGEIADMTAVTAVQVQSLLWKQGLIAVLLVQVRGEMAIIPAVTAVLLHQCAMDRGTECSVVSTWKRGNGGLVCSYCSIFT